jgi:hypothetical protein
MAGTIGGMAVTISIPRRPGEAVAIDTTPTTSAVVVNATTTAAGRVGTASVLARTLGGTKAANALFTYVTPALTVTITGTNPSGATAAVRRSSASLGATLTPGDIAIEKDLSGPLVNRLAFDADHGVKWL